MKKSFILAFGLAVAASAGAQQYVVSGSAPEGVKKVYLVSAEDRQKADSVVVENGKFAFTGDAAGQLFGYVFAEKGKDAEPTPPVVVELSGNVSVDFATGLASGTPENSALSVHRKKVQGISNQIRALMDEYRTLRQADGGISEADEKRIDDAYEALTSELADYVLVACKENPQALFPAFLLSSTWQELEKADVIEIAESRPAYFELSILDDLKERIEGWKRAMPGVKFTDIALADTTGTMHQLSEYVGRGNYVLIDFWASWCGPCIREMPNVKAAYERYHSKGFDIVGLSFDKEAKNWKAAIKRLGLAWHHLSDLKYWNTIASETYGISSIPSTLLVGPDGTIVEADLRGEALAKKLAEIYGE